MKNSKGISGLFCFIIFFSVSICKAQTFTETSIGAFAGIYDGKIVWLDVDNDNDLDLLISGGTTNKLYKNNNGSLTESFSHNLPPILHPGIASADFNNDGFVDLVMTGVKEGGDSNPVVGSNIFINDGTGSFTKSTTANFTPLYFATAECADFDLDGDADILFTGNDRQRIAQSFVYSNNGDGTFSKLSTSQLPGVVGTYQGSSGTWGDYDADGDADILISGDNLLNNVSNSAVTKIFRNKGDRTFEELPVNLPQLVGKASWVDVNMDGQLDIFVSGHPQGFEPGKSVLLINQNSNFTAVNGLIFESTQFSEYQWADFDNDGDKDLLAYTLFDRSVAIFINQGGSSFAKLAGTNFPAHAIFAVGNYDNDGDVDIIFSGFDGTANYHVKVFKNNINTNNNPPSTPPNLSVEVLGGTEARFIWGASSDNNETNTAALGYVLRIGNVSGSSDISSPVVSSSGFIKSSELGTPSVRLGASVRNLPNGTYYGKVQSVDHSSHASIASSEVSFIISGVSSKPLAPSSIILKNLNTGYLEVNWVDQSFNEQNFELERSEDGINYSVLNSPGKNQTSFVDKSVGYDKTYFYRIKAINLAGSSDVSGVASLKSLPKGIFKKLEGFELAETESNFGVSANWVDYNNDQREDIFMAGMFTKNLLFKNTDQVNFIRKSSLEVLPQQNRLSCWGDYDNDGDKDVFIASAFLNHLFRNNGDETFTEISDAPFNIDSHDSNGAAWVDYDNDGFLDLSVVNYQANTYLYHNNRNGTFTKITEGALASDAGNYASISWCDYNNDGWQDAYVVNYYGNSILYKNKGAGVFERISDPLIYSFSGAVTSSWGDYDNDGDFDVFVGHNSNESDAFFENNGDGSFKKVENKITQTNTNSESSSWGDFDNDGNSDLLVISAKKNILFKNTGSKNFDLLATEASLSDVAYGSGVASGDYNRDGFLDVVIANSYADNIVLKNNGNPNHWISVNLIGTKTNRDAIGTKIKIKAGGKWRTDFVASQSGSHGQNSFSVEFGLGSSIVIDSVVVEWPRNGFQVLTNVTADQFITITEPTFETAPALISAVNNGTTEKIDLAWTDLSISETGFLIERAIGTPNSFTRIAVTGPNSTSYSDAPGIEADSVFYRVSALTTSTNSWYSNIKSAFKSIKKPTNLQIEAIDSSLKLSWTDYSNVETSFEVYRSLDSATPSYALIATLSPNITQYIDNQVEEANSYRYQVRAKKNTIVSEYSGSIVGKSSLKKPSSIQIEWSGIEVTLKWVDNSSKESSYVIQRSVSDNLHFESIGEVVANSVSFTDKNLIYDKSLFYRVMAKSSVAESGFSEEVTAIVTGVDQEFGSAWLYPNPASSYISIRNNDNVELKVSITNSIGEEVLRRNIGSILQEEIDIRNLSSGVYMVSLIHINGKRTSRLLITR